MTTYAPETFPRAWLPEGVELKTWERIEPWYKKLLAMPVDTPERLEEWLTAAGELNAAVGQEGTSRYVAMTCQTDDPAREAAYLEFVREIEPKLKPYLNQVRNRFLDAPGRAGLPADRYRVFARSQENRRALYREANIPRETRLAELEQQYQKAIGAMTVEFQGQERTLVQLSPFLESTDRDVRRQAWTLAAGRRLADRDLLDGLFDEMRALRLEIAREAGFDDYVAYAYRNRERFDYGPEQARQFHDAIEKAVVPLASAIHRERKERLGVDSLRPWDLATDPLGRPPLKPFEDVDRLAEGCEAIFREVAPELGAQFAFMRERGLLDLANRKGKAPGGYQTTYEADRLPFIFMNAVGVDGDVRTLLHEGGHAFHTLAARGEPLAAYRESPLEFCEVASMTMELFGTGAKDPFYDAADSGRSHRKLLEEIVTILPWIATVDAFQHWIYDNPGHSRDDRRAAWRDLVARFGGDVDWSGLEDARDHSWHKQLHIFLYPFYYIEYGVAQLGALQIWKRSLTDRAGAVASYREALSIGGARPLPQLFEAAGARFAFDRETIAPLMDAVGEELSRLAP
ncbi:M3 family oligoendopeptidase [Paludisphaera sp.]|uniref:M3 family oligoendopeptidase n=1 Tax=Paludisphaera sp. TaxID=2017432 RepID=UPI00301D726F